jgi:hypothetical protein
MNLGQTPVVGAEAADLQHLYFKAPSASIKPLTTSKAQMIWRNRATGTWCAKR